MNIFRPLVFSLSLLLSAISYAGAVNINTADAETIAQAMNGVGIKKAQDIVAYRTKNGAFKSLEDLSKVKGIGNKTVLKNREKLTVEAVSGK